MKSKKIYKVMDKVLPLVTYEGIHIQDIIKESCEDCSIVADALVMLELQGTISQIPGKRYELNRVPKKNYLLDNSGKEVVK